MRVRSGNIKRGERTHKGEPRKWRTLGHEGRAGLRAEQGLRSEKCGPGLFEITLRRHGRHEWRSLGDSNPCFRRERATSWAARRRERNRVRRLKGVVLYVPTFF